MGGVDQVVTTLRMFLDPNTVSSLVEEIKTGQESEIMGNNALTLINVITTT